MDHPVKADSDGGTGSFGRKRPTQTDVAKLAGVSTATVSHVLSGRADRKSKGDPKTRAKVEQAMEHLGYRPNWAGRALRRQRTGLVGALVSSPSNPWRESLIALAQRELARRGLDLVVFPDARTDAGLDRFFDLLNRRAVDACFTVHVEDHDQPSRYSSCPIPVIAFAEDGFDQVAKVRHGYAEAAGEAARTLLRRGVDHFLLLKESSAATPSLERHFVDPARNELMGPGREAVQVSSLEIDYGISTDLAKIDWSLLESATIQQPVVVLCSSDRLGIQIVAECRRRGIDIGTSVGVVGRGNISEAVRGDVPLSTLGVRNADYEDVFKVLAEAAANGTQIGQNWAFEWELIERDSTLGVGRQV